MEPGNSSDPGRELAYYKRRLDELAGESLKLDYKISGLRKEVTQKRQAFALLSRLQQTVGAEKDASNIFGLVLREVNGTLGMDRTVVLTPTDREDEYRPTQWTGFTEQGRSVEYERRMAETTISFPHEFSDGTGWLLVNGKTEPTSFIATLRDTFELPFFLCVPVLVERKPIGVLLSGRIKEAVSVFPPLDRGDLETFQAIAGLVSASVENMRIGVLKEADRLKTEFFANISHEFRTPITLTLGPLEHVLTGQCGSISDEAREQLVIMQRSQERLLGLVNQILDLAKLEAGAVRLRAMHTRGINELVERRVAQFRPAAIHRGLQVRLRLDTAIDGADLYVDRERFDRLLVNLLANALKFTSEGFVEVSTWLRDESFWLQVTDSGIGIKEDQLPHIFDRFRQADGSESREYAGTGIGLALVQEIARAHSGEVSVFSQYGKGSSFRVRLPLGRVHLSDESVVESEGAGEPEMPTLLDDQDRNEPGGTETLNREAEEVFDAGRPTVLCAEDHPDLRRHIRNILQADYNVFVAADGHEALRLAWRYSPDLLLTDQMMPHMSGRELLRNVRQNEKLRMLPVVFLTARAGTDARIESLQGGADDYLTKPFHEGELKARVANLVRSRAQERELATLNRRLEARVEEQLAELVRAGELKRFLPQTVVESVLAGRIGTTTPFERRKVTVLFVDLAGFDEVSGELEPEDLTVIATDFTREMVAIAIDCGGTVTNITAQSMMILFEADSPHTFASHALAAARCAVLMRDGMSHLEAGWRRRGISGDFGVRAAINTGFCTVGVFGSEYLQCYTAVGSPVQIAARLHSTARPGQILCAMPAYAIVEAHVRVRRCGPLEIEGLSRPVEAFEIEGLMESSQAKRQPARETGKQPVSLAPGCVLGHYQIVKKIGKGGMGEVYRARDMRLDRVVALKLLPSEMNEDIESRQRFLREARAVAALRHPNIVDVYAVEEVAGRHFIVMELVDGERLADLIPPDGFERSRLLGVAVQLVEALASAHVSGVTHRDLKPANVMVDRDYGVKVLDFGLAKVTRQAVASSSIELSRDVITETGAILGTVPYMAPEQIQGKGADHRSDIFSLGVIMHEMAVGHRPFRGVTSAEIMASILRDEPESIATSRPDLPAPLARIIGRCLSKQPDRRYSSTKDLLRELEILR